MDYKKDPDAPDHEINKPDQIIGEIVVETTTAAASVGNNSNGQAPPGTKLDHNQGSNQTAAPQPPPPPPPTSQQHRLSKGMPAVVAAAQQQQQQQQSQVQQPQEPGSRSLKLDEGEQQEHQQRVCITSVAQSFTVITAPSSKATRMLNSSENIRYRKSAMDYHHSFQRKTMGVGYLKFVLFVHSGNSRQVGTVGLWNERAMRRS